MIGRMIQAPIQIAPGLTLPPSALCRHMGIFGATGTGKTNSATLIAQGAVCPVLILDAKGDLLGFGQHLTPWAHANLSVSTMGAAVLSQALNLSEAQAGALSISLTWAGDCGRAVHTLGDLRQLLLDTLTSPAAQRLGLVSPQSVAAVQRAILTLERATPWAFGPCILDARQLTGRNVLQCADLTEEPGLYGAFVADLLTRLYRGLGEIGDPGAAAIMIVIDESHLVFSDAPAGVIRAVEKVVRLIRSKGVSLVFISQSPADLPDSILGQLGSRIQHGLRAGTPRQAMAARAAAETMPGNLVAADVLALGTGQALVSVPGPGGMPEPARRVAVDRAAACGGIPIDPPQIRPMHPLSA